MVGHVVHGNDDRVPLLKCPANSIEGRRGHAHHEHLYAHDSGSERWLHLGHYLEGLESRQVGL